MTYLQTFAQHWLTHSLAWTLLHFCWQGALIGAVLWCALQLLAQRSAQARYGTGCAALLLMVVLPIATFARVATIEYKLAAGSGLVAAPALTIQAGIGVATTPWLIRLAGALDPALPWILVAYLAGSALFLLRLSVGVAIAHRMRLSAVAPADAHLRAMFAALVARLGVGRAVRLLDSTRVQVPTVIGWLRPVVLLPVSCFTGMSEVQVVAILAHELAHIRRHDYLVSVFQSVVETVLFYHPAAWWVSQQIRRERECCCDDLAVSIGGNALAYARALSTLETKRSLYPQVILGANGGVLTMRIQRLLHSNESSPASQATAVIVLALLLVSAVAVGSSATAQAKDAVPAEISMVALKASAPAPIAVASTKPIALPLAQPPAARQVSARPASPAPAAASAPVESAAPAIEPQMQDVSEPQNAAPIKVAGGVLAGQIISKTMPVYPPDAKAAHISGAVVMRALISKTGDVTALQVVSGPKELLDSALDAVRQWKYKPYLLNGEPTEVDTTITVNYSFAGQDTPPPPAARNEGPDAAGIVARPIGNGVSAPVLLFAPDPEYTAEARANKVSGNVLIHLWVDQQGNPLHVRVVRGVGYGLDEKAVQIASRYRFKPAFEDGKPVTVAMNAEINFQIF